MHAGPKQEGYVHTVSFPEEWFGIQNSLQVATLPILFGWLDSRWQRRFGGHVGTIVGYAMISTD